MRLIEALQALNQSPAVESPVLEVHLACGFTPLHFQTFLSAHLQGCFSDRKVLVQTGLFDDLLGNLVRLEKARAAEIVAIIEWADLDPRLGIRRLGGWGPRQLPEIVRAARSHGARLSDSLERLVQDNTVTLVLPTLPLPPMAFTPGWQSSSLENDLREAVASLAARFSRLSGARIVSPQRLDRVSPPGLRFDVKSDLRAGFPYALSHADALAGLVARIIQNPLPKKGLITDLDDTLWEGILGDAGVEGIAWGLDRHAQKHGLYQQLLAAMAEAGILIAVASKNDPDLAEEAFQKAKPILPRERVFPFEVNWGPKSESVSRILDAWNIGADSVVLVDDSPLELAEVKAAHPTIECLPFPQVDDAAAYQFLEDLRDLFGKQSISAEDEIRLESIRASHRGAQARRSQGDSLEQFLRQAGGKLTLSFCKHPPDSRALELINKTNQFNLNGKRYEEASWKRYLDDPRIFMLLASYEDRFGPLGKIAVMAGRQESDKVFIDHWVMSCRAFSRRIEHACLLYLFRKFGAGEMAFGFAATPRNGPLQSFFAELIGVAPRSTFAISRHAFLDKCAPVYLRIEEHSDD
jgi:FkbH-like protein